MIPKNWIVKELGDVAFSTKGKKPKFLVNEYNEEFSVPYVNIKAFEGRGINEYTNGEKCVLCKSTDILIVWDGARFGLVGKGVAGAIGSTLAHIQSKIIVDTLLFYFLQYHYRYIQSRPKGVGIPHVDPNILWKIKILIPPQNEQHRIVEKIEELFTKLDAAVTELKNVKKQLKRYRQSVLKSAFEGKLTEDDDWKWIKLNTVLDVKDGTHDTPKYEENGIPFITQKNIKNGKFLFENFKRINKNDHDKFYKRSNVAQNDIIISMIGANRGMSCIVDIDDVFSIKNVGLVKADFQKFLPKFLDYYFKSNHGQSSILSKSKGGAQQFIGLTELRNWEVPHALIDIQQKIVEEIESRFSVADKIEEEIDKNLKRTEQLRQSILKKAFEGKLVPQDPNDPPASELLEQIKKERNKNNARKNK